MQYIYICFTIISYLSPIATTHNTLKESFGVLHYIIIIQLISLW